VLVKNRPVREIPFIEPRLEMLELWALRRLLGRKRPQTVNAAEKALQPDISGLRWPRDNDPHLSALLVSSIS
jgi:hypothetical protein